MIYLKNSLGARDLKDMFLYLAQQIIDNEEYLTVIDKRIGDGDHGIGMSLGFREVIKELNSKDFTHINDVFQCVGITLLDTMGGASGVLFGTVFISGIVGLEPMEEIDLMGISKIFEKSLDALKRRGKAKVGDKTMVDAFEPAVNALISSAESNLNLCEAFEIAAQKAKEGMEYTKECAARFGRAKSYGNASIGFEDAGAVSVWIIFRSMAEWIKHCIEQNSFLNMGGLR